MWPDAELMLCELLKGLAPTVTKLPPDLAERVPLLRVRRIGGSDDEITDYPRMDVAAVAGGRDQAWQLARQVQALLVPGPHSTSLGLIDAVSTEVGPQHISYGNRAVHMVTATYQLQNRWPSGLVGS